MDTRILGRTGLRVGELGLGTEWLVGRGAATYREVIRSASERGVSYVDILFSTAAYRDELGAALRGIRERFVIAGHIGCAETDGQYRKTRDAAECAALFDDLLRRLGTDHVDIVMVQFVDTERDYAKVMSPGGLYELAARVRDQGKARGVGISTHDYACAEKAAASGAFDVIMFPLSIILAPVPMEGILGSCERNGVGLVAMKPFGGGRLFQRRQALGVAPSQLVGYPLLDPRVTVALAGVKSSEELEAAVAGVEDKPARSTFERVAKELLAAGKGDCVYCNHCLPCPVGINIAETLMYLDSAAVKLTTELEAAYAASEVKASACTACAACEKRCPWSVPVTERMRRAAALLGG
jgi:predicted aldo/keto reductase-like oxidoreductase